MMADLYLVAAIAVGVMLLFPLWRIVRGPTIFDRLLGASMLGTKTIVLLMLMGEAGGRLDMFVDISLGYGLALLAGTLVASKYLEYSERHQARSQTAARQTPGPGEPR
jgi:multicomponent Na+:H+ antiporter subunit F